MVSRYALFKGVIMLNWRATPTEYALARQIAQRAVVLCVSRGIEIDAEKFALEVYADILGTHLNGCPLRLADLLSAGDNEFSRDVFGIREHLDRKTGKLNYKGLRFLPNYRVVEIIH